VLYNARVRILLVEDNRRLGQAIREGLRLEGYAVDLVEDYEDGLGYAQVEDYGLLILDRMLPGGRDGLDICASRRQDGDSTPILMLTARGALDDKVRGLKNGADDYLVKPFEFAELLARVEALARRPRHYRWPRTEIGSVTIDRAGKTVLTRGKPVNLTKREYALLECLMDRQGEVVSKDDLIKHCWDFDADVLPGTVEVFVFSLRKKLDAPGEPSVIETVRGFGYRLRDDS
jgi:two-component system, OmpR family, response regulator